MSDLLLLREIYERALVTTSGRHQTTINEFCDQIPALRPRVLWDVALDVARRCPEGVTKVVGEEDKGAPLATTVSLVTGLPMCLARWYPYALEGQQVVEIVSEYFSGRLYLNGVSAGDSVFLVDDTISTGGTLMALIAAVHATGAKVAGAVAVVEKPDNGGVDRIFRETGVNVTTLLKIAIVDDKVKVL